MKKKTLLIFSIFLLIAEVFAQSPEKISYQAVIRDAAGDLVQTTTVGVQISILETTIDGTSVYVETHAPETNINGLVSFEIGDGTSMDDFDLIDWANGPYFLKTEIDLNGGADYTITSSSQLLSVPYALYANTADTLVGTISQEQIVGLGDYLIEEIDGDSVNEIQLLSLEEDTLNLTDGGSVILPFPDYHIGDLHAGGVVFYVEGNGEHGLVVSTTDLSTAAPYGQIFISTGAISVFDGQYNTDLLLPGAAVGDAVELAASFSAEGFTDWYLPSIDELNMIYDNRYAINKQLFTLTDVDPICVYQYWSSTEYDNQNAYYFLFNSGNVSTITSGSVKTQTRYVRAVRAF